MGKKRIQKLDTMVYSYNYGTQEGKAGRSQVQGYPWLCNKTVSKIDGIQYLQKDKVFVGNPPTRKQLKWNQRLQ